jgi:hypothetical protein
MQNFKFLVALTSTTTTRFFSSGIASVEEEVHAFIDFNLNC